MDVCHPHNLVEARKERPRSYGIRLSLPRNDPLIPILGADWEKFHWFATAGERDEALAEMRRRHPYSRQGDLPQLVFEKMEREGAGG